MHISPGYAMRVQNVGSGCSMWRNGNMMALLWSVPVPVTRPDAGGGGGGELTYIFLT